MYTGREPIRARAPCPYCSPLRAGSNNHLSRGRVGSAVVNIRSEDYSDPSGESPPTPDDFPAEENGARPDGLPDFDVIVGAPDLGALLHRTPTRRAREYRNRVASVLRVGMVGSLNTGNFADAAAFLWYGPGASTSIGNLADNYNSIAKGIDIITSPGSPIAECVTTLLPLMSQLARNHEQALGEIPGRFAMGKVARAARKQAKAERAQDDPPMTLHIGRWQLPVRWRIRSPIKFVKPVIRAQSMEPNLIAARVFMDPHVQKKLAEMGVRITSPNGGPPSA